MGGKCLSLGTTLPWVSPGSVSQSDWRRASYLISPSLIFILNKIEIAPLQCAFCKIKRSNQYNTWHGRSVQKTP